MEAVSLIRDKTFSPDITFTRLGENGPFVLFSNQLDYDYQTGFRVMGRYDLCPLTVLEFGYMGIFNMNTSASTTDPNPVNPSTGNLFSLFSQFRHESRHGRCASRARCLTPSDQLHKASS